MKIYLGERITKSEENPLGWNDKILFGSMREDIPIVICLPGSGTINPRGANGMCKSVETMLGISDLEDKPCRIYGTYYERPIGAGVKERTIIDKKANGEQPDISLIPFRNQENVQCLEDFAKQMVEELFMPMVQDENGKLHQETEIAKNFRNVIFVSFCFGSVVQSAINQELRNYLISTGLPQETIEKLERQICVVEAAPIAQETNTNQTTVNLVSLNDEETSKFPIQQKAIDDFNKQQNSSHIGGIAESPKANTTIYVNQFTTIQDEEHSGDFYLHFFDKWSQGDKDAPTYEEKVGGVLPLCMSICLRRALQNSICNNRGSKFVPLESEDLVKPCSKFMQWSNRSPQDIPQYILEMFNLHTDYENTNLTETLNM